MSKSGVEDRALNRNGVNAAQADQSFGTVAPAYTRLSSGTVGYTPQQQADMRTASLQGVSGRLADASGRADLSAARTGNVGASTTALDDISRSGVDAVSDASLGISKDNADLQQQNMRYGLAGLSNLYGTGTQAADANLATANSAEQAKAARTMGYIRMGLAAAGSAAGAV